MTNTYDTSGEPLGSSAPKVLFNNSSNFDEAVNSFVRQWVDRFGRARLTLYGMEQDYDQLISNFTAQFNSFLLSQGFAFIGDYDADGPLTVTSYSQMFSKDGEFWTLSPTIPLPYTTVNNWTTDRPKSVSRGDASVRQYLLQVLGKLDSQADKTLVDIHYQVCRGVGDVGPGGQVATTVSAAVSPGATIVPVTSVAGLVGGQLIVYLGSDGKYYTAVIDAIGSTNDYVILQTPVVVSINAGAAFGIFYFDLSHPTVLGYYALADATVDHGTKKVERVKVWTPSDSFITVGTATTGSRSDSSYANPGSSTTPSLQVTAGAASSGIQTELQNLPAGDYVARVYMTASFGSAAPLVTSVSGVTGGAISYSDAPNGKTATMRELYFRVSANAPVFVTLLGTAAGQQFAVAKIEFVRIATINKNLDRGTIVVLGDSWVSQTGFVDRLKVRLPNATIINAGVAGNTAAAMWARFATDVTPYNPTTVIVVGGTNDVAVGVTPEAFYRNMGIISQYILATGATGVFLNCSVGSPTHPTFGDLLTRSREYIFRQDYESQAPDVIGARQVLRMQLVGRVMPGAVLRFVAPGFTRDAVTLRTLYAVGQNAEITGEVRIGYSTTTTGLWEDVITYPWANSFRQNITVTKGTTANRFFVVEFYNPTAAAIDVGGMVEGFWIPV